MRGCGLGLLRKVIFTDYPQIPKHFNDNNFGFPFHLFHHSNAYEYQPYLRGKLVLRAQNLKPYYSFNSLIVLQHSA